MQIPERNLLCIFLVVFVEKWEIFVERERVEVGVMSACERTKGEFKFLKGNVIEKQLICVFRK